MHKVVATCLVLVLVVFLLPMRGVRADSDEHAAILAVMQHAFDAVRSQDPDEWRPIQLAEGTTQAQVGEMCEKLLANTVIESYRVEMG